MTFGKLGAEVKKQARRRRRQAERLLLHNVDEDTAPEIIPGRNTEVSDTWFWD